MAGREEQAIGGRMAAQQVEQLVGTLVEAVDLGAEMTLPGGRRTSLTRPTVTGVGPASSAS